MALAASRVILPGGAGGMGPGLLPRGINKLAAAAAAHTARSGAAGAGGAAAGAAMLGGAGSALGQLKIAVSEILAADGVKGFYAGLAPNLLQVGHVGAATNSLRVRAKQEGAGGTLEEHIVIQLLSLLLLPWCSSGSVQGCCC
jgi:hypothetical protein